MKSLYSVIFCSGRVQCLAADVVWPSKIERDEHRRPLVNDTEWLKVERHSISRLG